MDVATTGNTSTFPSHPNAANHKPPATSRKASAASTEPDASSVKTSLPVTANARSSPKLKSGVANAKPSAANSDSTARNNVSVPGTPKPKVGPTSPDAPKQMGPAELDAVHRKAIQSIDAAGKAMSVARPNLELAMSSKEHQNRVVAMANEVVGTLFTPSRHVAILLRGLGALFPPCKQVGSSLAVLIKQEVSRHEKDVRVAIVHFDLARALVHIGSLNRKSRPTKSIGEPLNQLLKDFKGVIQEFSQFCEVYYETQAPESALTHLRHWKSNKDSLNSFTDRIAQLKESLTSLLSQQAVQHPGNHTDVLAQIESRLAEHRAFYGTIRDANEEIAEALLSKQLKQGGEASVRLVQDSRLLKQFAGTVGGGVASGISNAIKKTTVSTLKQVHEQVAKTPPDAKTTRGGVRAAFASKLQGTLDKLGSSEQPKDRVDTKSGPPPLPERIHRQAPMTTHAPARGQNTGQQQMKNTGNTGGKLQTSLVAGGNLLQTLSTTAKAVSNIESLNKTFHDITGNKGKTTGGHASAVEQHDDRAGIVEQEPGDNSLDVENYEYADGELEGDDDDDQELYDLQGDEEIGDGLGVDGEDEDEDLHLPGDGSEQEVADYGDPEQEDEYACSERGVNDEGDQDVYDPSEGSSGDGIVNYEAQVQEDQYDDGEAGDDGGDEEAYYPQDDGDDDDGNGGIWTDLVDSVLNWSN